MESLEKQTTYLESIDLTGDEPVIKIKAVEKNVPVVSIDVNGGKNLSIPQYAKKKRLQKCEVCLEEYSKYTCPGCKMKTCCLNCVQKHKKQTGCSGERNKTEFVARTEFNNIHLLNDSAKFPKAFGYLLDYRLLEEANRIADNAKRDYRVNSNSKTTRKGNILQKAAAKNQTKIYRMAKGMKRWKENRSQFNIKEQTIYWTVKFVFVDIDQELISRYSENESMEDILSVYIRNEKVAPENKLKYAPYLQKSDDVTVFFKQELDPGENNLRYSAIDIKNTLKEVLMQKSILEYPVFHIALPLASEKLRNEPYVKEPNIKEQNTTSSSSDSDSDSDLDSDSSASEEIPKKVKKT